MLENLNKYQREVVETTDGPIRVIAGPGSGKTRTIIAKANYILSNGLANPNQLLILTFTNKASGEVKERLAKSDQTLKNVFTFHAFAAYFLRLEATRIGIDKDYIILDRNDQNQIIKRQIKALAEENSFYDSLEIKDVFEKFEVFKAKELENDNLGDSENRYEELIRDIYQKYKLYKKQIKAYDFDDLLINLDKILKENQEIRNSWQKKFKYIFVDEFQDVNKTQYSIIKSLTNRNSNITIVGDPDQNIYSWRGADLNYILNFDLDFESVKTIILKINYRSTLNIIEASNKLISHNKNRIKFEVINSKEYGDDLHVQFYYSKTEQAEQIVKEIIRLNKRGINLKDIAIIYRANYLSREFENVLARYGISYQLIGGFKFFDRKEVKELLFLIRFIIFQDDYSFINIINFPARGFGEKSLEKLGSYVNSSLGGGYWNAIKNNQEHLKLKPAVKTFVNFTNEFIEMFDELKTGNNFVHLFREYINKIGILEFYDKDDDKKENIEGFLQQLKENFLLVENLKDELIEFLNTTTLLSGGDNAEIENHVTLITAHASKGTEFDVVFVPSLNQDIFPSYRAIDDGGLEEERRVAYVAITRAKNHLYLSYVTGYDFNNKPQSPSTFLYNMDVIKKPYFKKNKFGENDDEEVEIPEGFSAKKDNVKVESIIFHKKYREGVVIAIEEEFIKVAFSKKIGVKTLVKNHPWWYLKL